jgi:predicted lipid carrier protein YhbT
MSFPLPSLPVIREFRLPAFIAALNRRLPQWPHALPICLALDAALKLGLLPEEVRQVCEGRVLCIEIEDAGSVANFTCRNGRFLPLAHTDAADVTFRGPLFAYLQLLTRQEDPDTLFFNRSLSIEGDTELGLAIKNLLDALDWPPPALAALLQRLRRA